MRLSKLGLYLLIGILLINISTFSQDWDAKQKEVWQNVTDYWVLDDKHDLDGFMNYFDDGYMGWSYDTEKPMNKTSVREAVQKDYAEENTSTSKLEPLSIWVDDDIAVVHYKYARTMKDASGSDVTRNGRWTDVLKRKGNKWVLVADHGGNWDMKK